MKPISCTSIAMVLLLVAACQTKRAYDKDPPDGPRVTGTGGEHGTGAPIVKPEPPGVYNAPATVFAPRQRPPRARRNTPTANTAGLPGLITRFDACRAATKKKRRPRPMPPIGAISSPKRGGGTSGLGIASEGVRRKSTAAAGAAAPKKKSARPLPSPPASKPAAAHSAVRQRGPAADSSRPAPAELPAPAVARQAEAEAARENRGVDRERLKKKLEIAKNADLSEVLDGDNEVATGERSRADYEDWGAAIYLSNDDTMSLSSAQRVIYAIDRFLPLPAAHIRPHELLNYFAFEKAAVDQGDDFSVLADMEADARGQGLYTLALAVNGRTIDRKNRRNATLTMVVDRSGSMSEEGRMNYLKRGLKRMIDELKHGDMVNLVGFDQNVCVPLENFVVGRDAPALLERAIDSIDLGGSTDLHGGISRGYEIADRTFRPDYSNRVVLITDALANTGVTDVQMMSMISKYYDSRRIRLSGIGVGRRFNDALLDRLTERGKGAYVFLGSEAEVDAVFGPRFISLIETTANNVRFRLHLPPSLRMNVFYGEESSTVKADVQQIHYFANTSQLFLSDLMARHGKLRDSDWLMLTIEYEDPEDGRALFEEYAFNLGQIEQASYNVKKARVVMAWVDLLAMMSSRPKAPGYRQSPGGWEDAEGWSQCEAGRAELANLARGLENDREVARVLALWEKYCARYDRPRNPVRRQIGGRRPVQRVPVEPSDSWPAAQPSKR